MVAWGIPWVGGFSKPHELSASGFGGLYVAELSSGMTYVAWDEERGSTSPLRWKLAVLRDGRLMRTEVLPTGLEGLVSDGSRKVAAVWGTYSATHFAFLRPSGQLQRRLSIQGVDLDTNATVPGVAVNDRGDLALVGIRIRGHNEAGRMLVLCPSAGGCERPIRLPVRSAYNQTTAVALNASGTATAFDGGLGESHASLWGVTAHVGRTKDRVRRITRDGQWPVAATEGRTGAVALFEPIVKSRSDTIALTFFKTKTDTFTKPQPVPDPHVETSPVPVIAANTKGEFVAAWGHFLHFASYGDQPNDDVRATIGTGTTPGPPVTIAPVTDFPWWASLQTGIDGHGDAIVTWSRFGGHGNHGLFEAIHAHG
jgi:hypothetical protein